MKTFQSFFFFSCITVALIIFGCASVEETSENPKQTPPPAVVEKAPEQTPAPITKTEPLLQQTAQRETTIVQPHIEKDMSEVQPTPTGNFSVQVGAFADAVKAEKATALARERFGNIVYKYYIKDTGLFKVFVGDFMTRDDARKFRDKIAQQFPDDYNNAWSAPIPYEKK